MTEKELVINLIIKKCQELVSYHTPIGKDISFRELREKFSVSIPFEEREKKEIEGIADSEIELIAGKKWQAATEVVAEQAVQHPSYGLLAGRMAYYNSKRITGLENLEPNINSSEEDYLKAVFFWQLRTYAEFMYDNTTEVGDHFPLISMGTREYILDNIKELSLLLYENDMNNYSYDYFAYQTLAKSYLLKTTKRLGRKGSIGDKEETVTFIETPQQMILRVAIGIHNSGELNNSNTIEDIRRTFLYMSHKMMTHASPTLFNAGTVSPQMSSCFLMSMTDDSLPGIFDTLNQAAQISKSGSGLAIHIHNIRSKGAPIKGNNGKSAGIIPMLKVFNETARYVDQAGKRKGAFAIYLEPWHADIFEFLDLRKNHGKEEMRARDLFLGLWTPDLFMERVKEDSYWTLFDPAEVRSILGHGLEDVYGDTFTEEYEKLEMQGLGKRIDARTLWRAVLEAQVETGTPYIVYKDAANKKSNQSNIGTIKSSNLCAEILEVSTPDETAVCNLSSLALPTFVIDGKFDFGVLTGVVHQAIVNMDKVIDNNYYPTPATEKSNKRMRPVGLGIQGLADVFMLMDIPFDSERAKELNKRIFEHMYLAALEASTGLAKDLGAYREFWTSPASDGILQHDMWNVEESTSLKDRWTKVREDIRNYGLRNSLLIALMPTATTGQILGNNECFEPYTSNIYLRRTLSGEFPMVNKHLVRKLEQKRLWDNSMRNKIIANNGSIQNIPEIPQEIKDIYKTAWEISQKVIIDMAADRGAFVDQSQSMNIFMAEPNDAKLTSMHFYAWEKGLKTGMYYLRTQPKAQAVKFTVEQKVEEKKEPEVCSITNIDCEACGS